MTEFDALKARREELVGIADVAKAIRDRERACEEAMAKAEQELNAVRKLAGYARIQIEQIKQQIIVLESER